MIWDLLGFFWAKDSGFCVLLAERFTDSAREWWITTGKNIGVNCWGGAVPGNCPPDVVEIPLLLFCANSFKMCVLKNRLSLRWRISNGKGKKKTKETAENKAKKETKDLTCYNCQKKGHISPNCPDIKDAKKKDSKMRSEI
jgi:Zinc knuckle